MTTQTVPREVDVQCPHCRKPFRLLIREKIHTTVTYGRFEDAAFRRSADALRSTPLTQEPTTPDPDRPVSK